MKLRMLDSGLGGRPAKQCASNYLVNDVLALDAECFGFWETPDDQSAIRYAVITHSHTDQIASLPLFPVNTARPSIDPGVVYRLPETLNAQKQFSNDAIWPDFTGRKVGAKGFLRWRSIVPNEPFVAAGLGVTATLTNHAEGRPPRIDQELGSAQMDNLSIIGIAHTENPDL